MLLFFFQFGSQKLGFLVMCSIAVYTLVTIVVTRWRKKHREETNKHDNDFHEKATDSIINFETVKYFNNESFESLRFKSAVKSFQDGMVATQGLQGILNATQTFVISATVFFGLVIASYEYLDGKLSVGSIVAINAYIYSMFAPLNYLGGVYNGIVQGLVDIRNLSDLLSQTPDVIDIENAEPLPTIRNIKRIKERDIPSSRVVKIYIECSNRSCLHNKCNNIEEIFKNDWKFCAFCGSKLLKKSAAVQTPTQPLFKAKAEIEKKRTALHFFPNPVFKNLTSLDSSSHRSLLLTADARSVYAKVNSREIEEDIELQSHSILEKVKMAEKKEEDDDNDSDDDEGLEIEFNNVSFHYPEQPIERGLKNVSFVVPKGTTTGLVGHTGKLCLLYMGNKY